MKFRLGNVLSLMLVVVISLVQTFLLRDHSAVGDGVVYKDTFESLRAVGLLDGYQIFQDGLGASEVFSYFIFYVTAQLFDYAMFIYLSNLAFAVTIYLVYHKYEKHIGHYLLTIPLNFYFLALCFGAQRLKLGMLFLLLAVLAHKPARGRGLMVLAILSHFQLLILFAAERIRGFASGAARLPWKEAGLLGALAVGAFLTVPLIQLKVLSYVLERGEVNLVTFLGSFLIAAYVSRFNLGVMAEFCFFLLLILVLGESRVNILVFLVLWRIIFLNRTQPAWIAYVIAFYLCWKGFNFMVEVVGGGTGFGGP